MRAAPVLLESSDLAPLLPKAYDAFRGVFVEGLTHFLDHLPAARKSSLLAAQAAAPANASVASRLMLLLSASPALHKLGQVLARRPEIDRTLRHYLQSLETLSPQGMRDEVRTAAQRELGSSIDRFRIHLEKRPLAQGSVAAVLPISWTDPTRAGARREGIVKVLKPAIVELVHDDLAILRSLAERLEARCEAIGIPRLRYREILADVQELLLDEVHLEKEQAHLALAARQFSTTPDLVVPALLPFCTPRLTAMERLRGRKITAFAHDDQDWRRWRSFRTITRGLFADVVLTRDESVLFHGDPHAGNLIEMEDGRVGIVDWSTAGTLTNPQREQLVILAVAAVSGDPQRLASAVQALSTSTRPELRRALEAVPAPEVASAGRLTRFLDALAMGGARFPKNLTLFRKACFTLEGVLGDVCPQASIDEELRRALVEALIGESPLRWLRPVWCREFDTHLSTADLAAVAWLTMAQTAWSLPG